MEVIRSLHQIKAPQRNAVITIGNFDGVHLGHQALLEKLKSKAKELQKPTLVILFEPQPNEFFSKHKTARLMRFREKVEALTELNIDYILFLKFDEQLAKQSAESFLLDLVNSIHPSYILVGDDFRFGCQRVGDIQLLQEKQGQYNYVAESMDTFIVDDERVSSSRVRKLLELGQINRAQELLGHMFTMTGRIKRGDQRGRLLGFPTANIDLQRTTVPVHGVFVVQMSGIGDSIINGVANVGVRPTISGQTKTLLEVHLFDFDQDIYGKRVAVHFLKKLRDERKYPDLKSLSEQLAVDVKEARDYF